MSSTPRAWGTCRQRSGGDPLAGCQDPATAIRRADAFAESVSQRGVEDASFWSAKASDYLRAYFHAAALARLDLRHVARWVTGTGAIEAEDILNRHPGTGRQWEAQLAELRGEANKTAQTIRMTMSRALAFLADPALAGSRMPGGRLDPPLLMALELTGPERETALNRLRAWVEHIYQPGYGHLAATLPPPCWEHHTVCLYTLDWLSELWSFLYLNPQRDGRILATQAEWHTRLLPAAADHMASEATGCNHPLSRTLQPRHPDGGSSPDPNGNGAKQAPR